MRPNPELMQVDPRHAAAAKMLVASELIRTFFADTLEGLNKAILYNPDLAQREEARRLYLAMEGMAEFLNDVAKSDVEEEGVEGPATLN